MLHASSRGFLNIRYLCVLYEYFISFMRREPVMCAEEFSLGTLKKIFTVYYGVDRLPPGRIPLPYRHPA